MTMLRRTSLWTSVVVTIAASLGCGPPTPGPTPVECEPAMDYGDVSALVSIRNPLAPSEPIRIDATEVTRGQYRLFLEATNGGTEVSGQPEFCAWNETYAPPRSCLDRDDILACNVQPQTCVDWCDAYMYCEWAGKRLCGRIRGGEGLPLRAAATLEDEWYVACSSGQQYAYSPGTIDDAYKCNTLDCLAEQACPYSDSPGGTRLLPPGSMPDCQSPSDNYHGVYDLTGNVWEWTNACDGYEGPDDVCAERGGSVAHGGGGVRCDLVPAQRRASVTSDVGFRCCANPDGE